MRILVTYVSEVVNAEDGISGIGKPIHQQQRIIIEAMDIWVVEENIPISLSWMRAGDVRWRFFDNLYFSSCLAGVEVA